MKVGKKLIEVALPLEAINAAAERSLSALATSGTLHLWWWLAFPLKMLAKRDSVHHPKATDG
jgi:hypothetical protein